MGLCDKRVNTSSYDYQEMNDEKVYLINNFDKNNYSNAILKALKRLVKNLYETNKCSTYRNYLLVPLELKKEKHLEYLAEYLSKLNCETIIGEDNYTDKTYVNDFSQFYVKCFPHYRKTCLRLHFFNKKIGEDELYRYVIGENKKLQEHYLGFSVIKPIPFFIGRTCLKPYLNSRSKDLLIISQRYNVNLFGIPLYIDSLIFHDKDKAVAACAAVALWICSYMTSEIFGNHSPMLSLYETTELAFKDSPLLGRIFPNKSLTTRQLASVIRKINLEPEHKSAKSRDILSFLYGYLHYRIPAILLIERKENNRRIGHAILVSGYSINNKCKYKFGKIKTRAHFIKDLIVHDDQVGPYISSEISIKGVKDNFEYKIKIRDLEYEIKGVIIPVYNKIRVSLEYILYNEFFKKIENIISNLILIIDNETKEKIETFWDIYLTDVNVFKKEIKKLKIKDSLKKNILFTRYPKYIWRVICYIKKSKKEIPIFEFQIDATDLPKSIFIFKCFFYDEKYYLIFEDDIIKTNSEKYKEMISKIKERGFYLI